MFYHIEGVVAELQPGLAVIDCGGIGFALNVTAGTVSALKLGTKAKPAAEKAEGEEAAPAEGEEAKPKAKKSTKAKKAEAAEGEEAPAKPKTRKKAAAKTEETAE